MLSQKSKNFRERESLKKTKLIGEYLQKDLQLLFKIFCFMGNKNKIGTLKTRITFI